MATNQETLIAALQARLGAGYENYSLEGLWHAVFDADSIAAGPFNQRLLTWLNTYLSTSHEDLPRVQQLYAEAASFYNWSSINTWVVQITGGLGDDGNPTPDPEQELGDEESVGVTSDQATFAADTTAGNAIVVAVAIKGTTEVDTITDNQSNIYARIGRVLDTDVATEMWAAYGIAGGSTTITITYSAATNAGWSALEITGVKNNNAIDYSSYVENTGGGGSSDPATVTGNTPAAANNLWLASLSLGGGGTSAGIITPTDWAEFSTHQDYDNVAAGQANWIDDATGEAKTASWDNNTTTANYAAMIVALKNVDAPVTEVDGEGEIAAIANRDGTDSIFLNANDLQSMTLPQNTVRLKSEQWVSTIGDQIDIRLSKTWLGGLTGDSYLENVAVNRVTNGGFDDATGWTLGGNCTISGGTANFDGTSCSVSRAVDNMTGVNEGANGDLMRLEFTVTEYNSGTLTCRIGSTNPYQNVPQATGTYIFWQSATLVANVDFTSSDFDGKIDNVIMKHVPGSHAFHDNGSHGLLAFNLEAGIYGMQHQADSAYNFRPAMETSTALQDFEYYIARDLGTDDQAIWIGDGNSNFFDIYHDGDTAAMADSGTSWASIRINDSDQGTPNRDQMYDALIAAGPVSVTNYRGVNLGTQIEEATLHFGEGYTASSGWDPVSAVDFGMLIRPNDQKAINNGERRRIAAWYSDLTTIDTTLLHVAAAKAEVYSSGVGEEARLGRIEAQVAYTVDDAVAYLGRSEAQVAYTVNDATMQVGAMDVHVPYTEDNGTRVAGVVVEVIYTV